MVNLIKFEFRKVLRSKYMYIILGIGVLSALLTPVTIWAMNLFAEELGQPVTPFSAYLSAKAAIGSSFSLFAGIFIGIFATEDFAQHTNKNIIARGYTRLQLYFSKYIVSLVILITFALLQVLVSLSLGAIMFGDGGLSIDDNLAVIIFGQLLCILAYHSLFFGISYAISKTAGAIIINVLVTQAVTTILTLIDIFVNNEELVLTYYWIDGVLSNLSQPYTDTSVILPGVFILLGVIALSQTLGILTARRKQF